jgi:hypothetical protein
VEYECTTSALGTPQVITINPTGPQVLHISYTQNSTAEDREAATYGKLQVSPSYTCDVTFMGTQIIVQQHLVVQISAQWDETSAGCKAVDRSASDTYDIKPDEYGFLLLSPVEDAHTFTDNSESPDRSGIVNFFTHINDIINEMKDLVADFSEKRLESIRLDDFPRFIFPGGKVFTFRSARFSNYQDLVCDITYVDPSTIINAPATSKPAIAAMATEDESTGKTLTQAAKPAAASPLLTVEGFAELMQNYVQGEIVDPTTKFEALQAADGHALLFAIDSSGVLHVIEESSGTSNTGWNRHDLSSAPIQATFPGAKVRTFDVAQNAVDGTIGILMVVSSNGSDNLLACLYNDSANTSWIRAAKWDVFPFDAVSGHQGSITIVATFFAETDNGQYLIVDINDSTNLSIKNIERYYVDPARATGTYWVKHDVPVDIEHGNYQSCVGRVPRGYVDGVYTSGMASGTSQLIYVPILNVFGSGPPLPTRLSLSGGAIPSAIATSRDVDNTTDLYAISGTTLYRISAKDQIRATPASPMMTNPYLSGTTTLTAMNHNGVTTLWGKNGSNEAYYVSCPVSQLANPGSWSAPVPILRNVERISAFLNQQDGGNTIFASGGGKLYKLIQATDTATKIWRSQQIVLPIVAPNPPLAFNSYTTIVHVTNADGQQAGGAELTITTFTRTPVYINGLYYLLGPEAVRVRTDAAGTLTVVEATDDLTSGQLTISADGGATSVEISPMNKAFEKLRGLNSETTLRASSIPNQTVAGGVLGPTGSTPLVAPSTSSSDVKALANAISNLSTVYSSVANPSTAYLSRPLAHRRVVSSIPFAVKPMSLGSEITIAAGDLFHSLKSAAS